MYTPSIVSFTYFFHSTLGKLDVLYATPDKFVRAIAIAWEK